MTTAKKNKPAFALISGATAITAAITSIVRRGKVLDRDIQVAALSTMQHHSEHGDSTLINTLVAGMPKGSRVNALKQFIETFGGVAYDVDEKKFTHVKGKVFDIEGAMSIMWTEYAPEAVYVPITDTLTLIKVLAKKLEKDVEKMGDSSLVDMAILAQLEAMVTPEVSH